jgi:Cysteine-rich secretory protein family
MRYRPMTFPALAVVTAGTLLGAPAAQADNKRLNDSVVANVFTVQHQAGCTNDVKINPQLQLAAQWHTLDVLNNRNTDGDIGSDGSTAQDRANAAGYKGRVAETVAINPALAISGVELMNQWYYNPAYFAIMSNCANTQIGVWSESSPDRTVVVAMYGQPDRPVAPTPLGTNVGLPPPVVLQENVPLDPSPDYDASDEIEFGISWLPWILRGVYPPPGMPPQ